MNEELDPERLVNDLSLSFVKSTVMLEPGRALPYDAEEWRDAIVFVTAGQIEVECARGLVERFGRGDILCFSPLALRAVRCSGSTPARLVAISRRSG